MTSRERFWVVVVFCCLCVVGVVGGGVISLVQTEGNNTSEGGAERIFSFSFRLCALACALALLLSCSGHPCDVLCYTLSLLCSQCCHKVVDEHRSREVCCC